jgi:hypothetical protein
MQTSDGFNYVVTTCASAAHGFDWGTFLSGLALPIITALAIIIYNNRKTTASLRRWILQNHFDLFQDVADCASEYQKYSNFGPFGERLHGQIRLMRDALQRDLTAGLSDAEYQSIYHSVSSAEYMLWARNHNFARGYTCKHVNSCLAAMRMTQDELGPRPAYRKDSEVEFMEGKPVTEEQPASISE